MKAVIFALDPKKVGTTPPGTIVISPSADRWNDFGFRIQVNIMLSHVGRPDVRLPVSGYFGFLDKSKKEPDARLLKTLLEEAPEGQLRPDEIPKFFMMLPDMRAYREVVSFFEPERAVELLVAINDLVAADEGFSGTSSLRDAKDTDVFKEAFLRSSEAFFAWSNAGPILRGLKYEDVGTMSDTFRIRFQLDSRPNEHDLSFKFDVREDILPRRFAIVIGENGVGKSQTLGNIAKAALAGTKNMTARDGARPSLNRVLAFAPTSTSSSVFPTERRKRPKVWYRRFSIGQSTGARGGTASEFIMKLARSHEQIRTSNRLKIFLNAISAIDDWEEIGLRMSSPNFGPSVHLGDLSRGAEQHRLQMLGAIDLRAEPVRLLSGKSYPLSSGELSFLRFAAIASLHIENGTLVLLDEPETHLHPNFISQFVAVLDNLLEQTGSAAIIATHSVYFVREAFEDQVLVLRSGEDRAVFVERPTLKTFGADVGSISYFVFGEDQPSRLARKVEERIAEGSHSWTDAFDSYKDELSLDLLGEIRERIEPPRPASRR